MKFTYQMQHGDYIDAMIFKRLQNYKKTALLWIAVAAVLAAGLYYNLTPIVMVAGLNGSIPVLFAAVAALLVVAGQFPWLSVRLRFAAELRNGGISKGFFGEHMLAVNEDSVIFSFEGWETAMKYENIAYLVKGKRVVLFFTNLGAMEFVPLSAFGDLEQQKEAVSYIQRRMKFPLDKGGPNPGGEPEQTNKLEFEFAAEDFIHTNSVHAKVNRMTNFKHPLYWFWLLMFACVIVGALVGIDRLTINPTLGPTIMMTGYYFSILAAVCAFVVLWRPKVFVDWAFRSNVNLNVYPRGSFGERVFAWDGDAMTLLYEDIYSQKLAYSTISCVYEDGESLYLYRGMAMIATLPKRAFEKEQLGDFKGALEKAALQRKRI